MRELSRFDDSTALLDEPDALRSKATADGYLFFRALLDPGPVLQLRRDVLGVLDAHGLLAPEAGESSGKLDLERLDEVAEEEMRLDIGVPEATYAAMQRLPSLHRLPHHPALVGLYRALFDTEVLVHPRHIMRAMTPHRAVTPTPAHQDFPLVQGTTETWTCWLPVGDCPLELGPLAILRGSHRSGCLPTGIDADDGTSTAWAAQLCDHENDWVGGDFAVGDVLTFPSLTVHRALRASVRDEVRLSLDVRYQRASDPIEERSLTNHSGRSWEEIYAGWSADEDLQYYWHRNVLALTPWDESLVQADARRIC